MNATLNLLIGLALGLNLMALGTSRLPMPSNSPRWLNSGAPLCGSIGGWVNSASSRWYSQ